MTDESTHDITEILTRAQSGDPAAEDDFYALVYQHLRALAQREGRRWGRDKPHDTTSLVHEAFLRLTENSLLKNAPNRRYFFVAAARAMRRILCDHARACNAMKRGGAGAHRQRDEYQARRISLDDMLALLVAQAAESSGFDVVELDEALQKLGEQSDRQLRVVECRFFGGLSIQATAECLEVSKSTVEQDWRLARAKLYQWLGGA